MTEAEMLARIDALQQENASLKTKPVSGYYTSYSDYKGRPVIVLNGPMRPFVFGRSKAKAVVALFEDVKRFAESGEGDE